MLARDLKISCIMVQRRFILEYLEMKMKEPIDGDPCIMYIGQVFKENILYFTKEGFRVEKKEWPVVEDRAFPVAYIFYVDENMADLSDEDMEKAKEFDKMAEKSRQMQANRLQEILLAQENKLN